MRYDAHVTVTNPDDPMGMPAYDGPANDAYTVLTPGEYDADHMTDDLNSVPVKLIVRPFGSTAVDPAERYDIETYPVSDGYAPGLGEPGFKPNDTAHEFNPRMMVPVLNKLLDLDYRWDMYSSGPGGDYVMWLYIGQSNDDNGGIHQVGVSPMSMQDGMQWYIALDSDHGPVFDAHIDADFELGLDAPTEVVVQHVVAMVERARKYMDTIPKV